MEGMFLECGLYAQRLSELAKKVKSENNNNLSERAIVRTIIETYQEALGIISTYPDVDVAHILSTTVGYMEKNPQMIATGTIDPKKLALDAVTDAIKESTNKITTPSLGEEGEENVASLGILDTSGKEMKEKMEFLDNISSYKNEQKFNKYFQDAKSGDEKSTIVLGLLNKYNIYMATMNEVTEASQRGAIILMQRLMVVDDPQCKEMAQKLAEKFELDVLREDESGAIRVDQSKLDEITKEKVGKINASYSNSEPNRYKKMNSNILRTTKETLQDKTSIKEYLQYSEEHSKQFAGRAQFNKIIRGKEQSDVGVQNFIQAYPKTVRKLLSDRADMIENLQKNSKASIVVINKKQKDLIVLSNIVAPIINNRENQFTIVSKENQKDTGVPSL